MKKIAARFRSIYTHHDYFNKKKAEYTAVLLLVVSIYAITTCMLFRFEDASGLRRYYVLIAVVTSVISLLRGRLELSQNILLSILIVLMTRFYGRIELFHFYGEMIILLFVTLIVYVKRYQYIGVLTAIGVAFYGRYQMTRSYIFLLDHNRMQSSQHIFIMTTLFMLILLGFYVNRMIHRSIHENRLLEDSVHIDLLTELYTRTKFNDDVSLLFRERGQVFSEIAILDIDKFKVINDTYGHHMGDKILKRLAYEMKIFFPEPLHRVYRWGGEEFIVLSADKSSQTFDKRLNTFRQYVDEVIVVNDLNVTISIGTASIDTATFKKTFCRADNALYKAKSSGCNLLVRGEDTSECFEVEATESI